jgi:serine protease Do
VSGGRFSAAALTVCAAAAMALGLFAGGEAIRFIYADDMRHIIGNRIAREDELLSELERVRGDSALRAVSDGRANAIVHATSRVAPSVVGIVVTQIQVVQNPYAGDNFFDFFFGPQLNPQRYRSIENIGSGFVISEGGMILTNYHVVKNAARLYVNFPDGSRVEGKIVGVDEKSDIAVISARGGKYTPAALGNSDKCLIGEWSIALGNPFLNFINDARPTVTVGVISAINRNFAPSEGVYYQGMIQTDASINSGNSGGPLVNSAGEVIGINSFIYTGSAANTGSIGIGFAIPINRAQRVASELIAHGNRRPVWTGITVQDINRAVSTALNHKNAEGGVVVVSVKPNSPGDAAGIKPGDIIHKMRGRLIMSSADLDGFFIDYFVNDTVEINLIRNGKQVSAEIALVEYPKSKK